jgi:hypothetical protein
MRVDYTNNGPVEQSDFIPSYEVKTTCRNKKPLICQAGSAEAFIGSTTTGGERLLIFHPIEVHLCRPR